MRGGPVSDRALVLGTRKLGEGSRIVSALTRDHGRVALVARGSRRSTSRLRSLLEPGNQLELQFYPRPDRELWTLGDASLVRAALTGAGSLDKLSYLLAVLELADRLLPEREAVPELVQLYERYLDRWHLEGPQGMAALFFALEGGLLHALGLGIDLWGCGECGKRIEGEASAIFRPEEGALLCSSCAGSRGQWLDSEGLRAWRSLEGLLEGGEIPGLEPAARRRIGRLLHQHMLHHLPRYRVPRALYWLDSSRGEQGA